MIGVDRPSRPWWQKVEVADLVERVLDVLQVRVAHHFVDMSLEFPQAMRRAFFTKPLMARRAIGKSFGPITTSATAAIRAISDHAKSNMSAATGPRSDVAALLAPIGETPNPACQREGPPLPTCPN